MTSEVDVLVVGAGPTGLTTAIEVARRGASVRIVERRDTPSTTSKALVVHARTLELFDTLGIADELVAAGYTSPGIDFSGSSDRPLRADMRRLGHLTRFPFILIVPQAETEAALERRLHAERISVERTTAVTTVAERDGGVDVTLERDDGTGEAVRARYVVGCDGAHSVVREALQIPFNGSRYGWTAFLGDVTMEGYHAEGGTEQHSSDRGLAFIVPFRDGSHRVVTIDQKYQGGPMRSDLQLDELQESISAIAGKPIVLSNPRWLTRWGADLRIADVYGRGRIFLAGDAAHTHSPAGGQGLNTGVQDAFGLGWRLTAALAGEIGGQLEAWRRERHAQGRKVLFMSDLLLRSLLLRSRFARTVRELLFEALIPLPPVQRTLAMNLSALGVRYGDNRSLAGARVPDLAFVDGNHHVTRLYERLRSGRSQLLLYVEAETAEARRAEIEALIAAGRARRADVSVVLRSGVAELHRFDGAATLVDFRGDVELRIGNRHPRTLMIRPDGYVSLALDGLDAPAFTTAYAEWVRSDSAGRLRPTATPHVLTRSEQM